MSNLQLTGTIESTLKTHTQAGAFFLLALSGGMDSVVLLHTLKTVQKNYPFKLHALHVHHGLSTFADDWANHCQQICQSLNVPLKIIQVQVRAAKTGIEAAARALRYEALMSYNDAGIKPDFILTAHHQQDQAETLLLQLSRGAGVKGLASMAIVDNKKKMLRPFLHTPRSVIQAYAATHQLRWCEDDSNTNIHYARNFLRHQVFPVFEARYPAIVESFCRSASHLAEANILLDALAEDDAKNLVDEAGCLDIAGLKALDYIRAKNLIRYWIAKASLLMPSANRLEQILDQLLNAKNDAQIRIRLQGSCIQRFRNLAYIVKPQRALDTELVWTGQSTLNLPDNSQLLFNKILGKGLVIPDGEMKLSIKFRKGGELLKLASNRPTRTLKHLLQEAQVPPWQRQLTPLIYWKNTLVAIPNIGIQHEFQAGKDDWGVEVVWRV